MKTKRFLMLIAAALTVAFGASAQNMTQQQANQYLAGTWNAGGKILDIAESGSSRSARIYGQDFSYWSIYTNTFNFATGSLQATNSDPQRNITVKYRNLTQNSCEFFIDGNWVRASKGGTVQRTTTTTVQKPVTNERNTSRTVSTSNVQLPTNGTIQRPTNGNVQKPATIQGKVSRPTPTNNVQRPTQGTIQRPTNNNGRIARPADNNRVVRPSGNINRRVDVPKRKTSQTNNATTTQEEEAPVIIN